jgi:hypothetical protein
MIACEWRLQAFLLRFWLSSGRGPKQHHLSGSSLLRSGACG